MTTNSILTFTEALNSAKYFNKKYSEYKGMTVLLANGFSIDCCKDIFTYKKLFDTANFSQEIYDVFKEFQTFDFEKVIKKFNDSSKILNIYKDIIISKRLKDDANIIKDELVNVISKKHPKHQHQIDDNKFCSAYKFLSNFEKIYTLNYDMLLYWTLMYKERSSTVLKELKIPTMSIMDGFGRLPQNEDLTLIKNL